MSEPAASNEVWTRAPDGGFVTFPAENVGQAVANGYQVAPAGDVAEYLKNKALRQEAGSLTGMAQAGAEGIARGATFGLSDELLTGAGVSPEAMLARREENPITSTVTEIGGAVAPALLSGGTGAAGTLARLAPSGALARGTAALGERALARVGTSALGRIATGAGTAALEGAAYGAGQQISEAALTDTELTAERILAGAGDGALFGGALGGGGALLGTLISKGGQKLAAKAPSLAETAEEAAFRQLSQGSARATDKATKFGGQERLRRLGRRLLDDGVELKTGKIDDAIEAITSKGDEALDRMKTISKQLDEAGVELDSTNVVSKVRQQVDELKASDFASDIRAGKKLERELAPMMKRIEGGEMSFSDAWDMRRALGKKAKFDQARGNEMNDAMQRVYSEVNKELDALAQAGGDDALRVSWRKANQDVSDYITLSEIARQTRKDMSRRGPGATAVEATLGSAATLTGSILGGGSLLGTLGGMATGAAAGAVQRYIRSEGSGLIARAADRMSKAGQRTEYAAKKLVGGRALPPPERLLAPVSMPIRQRVERINEDIDALTADPHLLEARLTSLTSEVADTHPELAAVMQDRFLGDMQHLRDHRPGIVTDTVANSLTPQAKKPAVSKADGARFLARVDALSDPTSVLEDVADGKINMDAIDTLKQRRPKIYEDMRLKVMQFAAAKGDEIPYKQRVALSVAFDFAADPSLTGAGLADIQASFAAPPTEQSTQQKPPGKLEESGAEATLTPSQRSTQSQA